MASEEEALADADDLLLVVLHGGADIFFVLVDALPDLLQDPDLHPRVVVVERCVPVDLYRHLPHLLVVIALHHLPKSPFVDFFDDFEPVFKVVSLHHFVEAALGVEAMVVPAKQDPLHVPHFLCLLSPRKVDVRISVDLLLFIGSEFVGITHQELRPR